MRGLMIFFAALFLTSVVFMHCSSSDISKDVTLTFIDELRKIPLIEGGTTATAHYEITNLNNKIVYAYLNIYESRIEVYNFDSGDFLFKVDLAKEGPNKIEAYYFTITENTFCIIGTTHLYLVDWEGKIISKSMLMSNSEFDIPYREYWLRLNSTIRGSSRNYNSKYNNLFLALMRQDISSLDSSFFQSPSIMGTFDLKEQSAKAIPVTFPDKFSRYKHFGTNPVISEYILPNILVKGDSIIYNFTVSSDIYIYDVKKQQVVGSKKVNGKYTAHEIEPMQADFKNADVITRLLFYNPSYGSIVFDPYRNYYYRIHFGPSEDKVKPSIINQQRYFSVIDQNFNLIKEFKLDKSLSHTGYYPAPEGIYFKIKNPPSEDTTYFKLMQIE